MSSILKRKSAEAGHKVQWIGHDKRNGKAAQRRLRQQAALAAKSRKQTFGIDVDTEGRTPAGLIIPGQEPRRPKPSMGGFSG